MNGFCWIMSGGGPLIAMESKLQISWGGVLRLTVAQAAAETDYDRPPEELDYLQSIDLHDGSALIFGNGPLDTAFWQSQRGKLFIVRVIYCEPSFDFESVMRQIDRDGLCAPCEEMDFSFATGELVMFDSADDGAHTEKERVQARILPGKYKIITQTIEYANSAYLILHRFDRVS